MFTRIFEELEQGTLPDPVPLGRLFDMAMTKKLGVVKLPPAFWMQDPKINPRSDHLLQAALLLGDRERCDLALSVVAVEAAEKQQNSEPEQVVAAGVRTLLERVPEQHKKEIISLVSSLYPDFNFSELRTQNPEPFFPWSMKRHSV
jgi:hypothetical protein